MTRLIHATCLAVLVAGPAIAAVPGPTEFYRPAEAYHGDARVWSTTTPGVAPACPNEDDVQMLKSAMRDGDSATADQLQEERGCLLLNDVSHGEIIGASLAGLVIRVRMSYMPGFSEETPDNGPELFLNVSDVVTMTGEPTVEIYNAILGR